MPVTLKEAAAYTTSLPHHGLLEAITRDTVSLKEFHEQWAAEWAAKPWHERARIRTKNWLRAHTPHIHVYLGEHPSEDE